MTIYLNFLLDGLLEFHYVADINKGEDEMKAYGSKRTYGGCKVVLAGQGRKITVKVMVKNPKAGRTITVKVVVRGADQAVLGDEPPV